MVEIMIYIYIYIYIYISIYFRYTQHVHMEWRNIDHPSDGDDKLEYCETNHKRKSKQN